MIIDYPCANEIPWTPKGMRKPRSFAYPVSVPVEIRDLTSEEAPAVVKGDVENRYGQENVSTFRKVGDDWFVEDAEALTVEAVLAKPEILRFCRNVEEFDHWSGISRGKQISEGPTKLLESTAELPPGKDASPPGYDPTDGRRDAILAAARNLVFVDGRLCRRSVEPTLVIETSHYFGHPSYTTAKLTTGNAREARGQFYRADQLEQLAADYETRRRRAEAIGSKAGFGELPKVEVLRPDLLGFDAFPDAIANLSASLLRDMKDHLTAKSVDYFVAFAALRDAVVPEVPNRWNGDGIVAPTHASPDRLYEVVVPALRAHLPYLATEWNHMDEDDGPRRMLEQCVKALDGTRGLAMLKRDFAGDIERLEVALPGFDPLDPGSTGAVIDEDDVVALVAPRP